MERRAFLAGTGAVLLSAPLAAETQPAGRLWRIGLLGLSAVPEKRIDAFRLPDSTAKRADLAVRYGRDGYHLLRQVHGPGAPGWLAGLPAVQALRRVWI